MTRTAKLAIGVLGALVLMLGGTWIAQAAIPSADGTITACYTKPSSALRVINADTASCKRGETALTWNQEGAPGVSGYEVVTKNDSTIATSPTDIITDSVACPLGKVAVGGGGNGTVVVDQGDALLVVGAADVSATFPIEGDANDPAEWAVRFAKLNGTAFAQDQGVLYTLFVTCVDAS